MHLYITKALSFLVLVGGVLSASAQNGSKRLTLEEIMEGAFSYETAGYNFRPTEDGACYSILSQDRERIEQYRFDTGALVDTLFDLTQVSKEIESIDDYLIAPGGNEILIFEGVEYIYRRSWKAKAYRYDVRRRKLTPLDKEGKKIMNPTFSPDGRMVAFVRDNNIYIYKFDYESELAVTTDGERNKIINGATDWVYEEEFGVTNTLTWSESGAYLAYVRFDESEVGQYGFQTYTAKNFAKLTTQEFKYPFAGEANSKVSVHVYNISDKVSHAVNLPIGAEHYIPRIEFTPMKGQLAVFTLNRHQSDFQLHLVNPSSLVSRPVLKDNDEAYIDSKWVNSLIVEKEGFVMVSYRDGYSHIYRFDANGQVIASLTKGDYDVTALYGVDPKGNIYYQAADQSPISRRVLRVSPKGEVRVLAGERGINSAAFSEDYSFFLNSRSNAEMPHLYTVSRSSDGKMLRTIEDNAALREKLANYRFRPAEFTTIKSDDSLTFNAYLIKPADFDPNKQYPLLMVQYSGPDSQEALDRFGISWEHFLAQEGYIVACVDGRGTGARGRAWRKCTYLQLGVLESDDQIAAAQALGKLPFIDASRIGIWGWSFGGYNTLLCLSRGNGVFKAGIAVAPVTDFRFYDTVYAERFLRTPQENPAGYSNGSPLALAKGLKGNLLIIHGSADDNVHLRNTLLFTEELVQADIPFEMAIYTNRNHGIYGGNTHTHLYKRKVEFLKRNL